MVATIANFMMKVVCSYQKSVLRNEELRAWRREDVGSTCRILAGQTMELNFPTLGKLWVK